MGTVPFWGQAALGFLLVVAFIVVPGRLLLRLFRLECRPVERLALSLGAGFSLLAFAYWILSALRAAPLLPYLGLAGVACEGALVFRDRKRAARPAAGEPGPGWVLWVLVLAGLAVQGLFIFRNGYMTGEGFVLFSTHATDAPGHIFIMEELARHFPPACPGFSGLSLHNYHYFFNLVWAALMSVCPLLDPWTIYFKLNPLFSSLFLSLAAYAAGSGWAGNRKAGYAAAALTNLCSNFGFLFTFWFNADHATMWDASLWIQSTTTCVLNPPGFLSFAVMLCGMRTLQEWVHRKSVPMLLATVAIWACLPGLKMYAAALVLAGLAAGGLWEVLFQRRLRLWTVLAGLLPIHLAQFHAFSSGGSSLFIFFPGFNLATLLFLPGMMHVISASGLAALYQQHPAAAILLIGLAVPIFALGNLGVRVIGLPLLVRQFLSPRRGDPVQFFILAAGGAALAGAVLFIQAGVFQWNTIQFYYYAVLLGALPAATVLAGWLDRLDVRRQAALWAAVLALGLAPLAHDAFFSKAVNEAYVYPRPQVEACLWLRDHSGPDSVVLCPLPRSFLENNYHSWNGIKSRAALRTRADWQKAALAREETPETAGTPAVTFRRGRTAYTVTDQWAPQIVGSLSARQTYLEQPLFTFARLPDAPVDQRIAEVSRFYAAPDSAESRRFLESTPIDYVLLPAGLPDIPAPATVCFSREGVRMVDVRAFRAGAVRASTDPAAAGKRH